MLDRSLSFQLAESLDHSPAVVLLGPRQLGKTTLALAVGKSYSALYLDLESEQDSMRKFVVYPGTEHYRMASDIEAMPLTMLATEVIAAGRM